MIVQKEVLTKLSELGLNTYEAKLWAALLSRGVSTAGELSDIANVPRSRSYDVLESLEKKGFVVMKLGKPIKYIAVKPSDVLDRVKQNILKEAEENSKNLSKLHGSDLLNELNLLHSKGVDMIDPTELSGSFKGRNNLYNHLDTMIKTAQKTIVISTTEEGLLRKAEFFRRSLYRAKEGGVSIKIVAPITEKNKESAQKLSEYAEVKNTDKILGRFIVIDGKQITFMIADDSVHPNYDSGIWINSSFFANSILSLLEITWKKLK
jgi:HTH-type transcriptional regulator, sugar sensing transcriptional regulator